LNKRKTDAEVEKLLREEIRRRATNNFFEAMEHMAVGEGAPCNNIWLTRTFESV
jgi:hypothetical protein